MLSAEDRKSLNNDPTVQEVDTSDSMDDVIKKAIFETKDVVEDEKNISVLEAVKLYPKEIFWSCVFSLGVVMAGYDGQIISSFYALPAFQKKFGSIDSSGNYEISAAWQTALGMGSPIGQVIGTLVVAWPLEKYGRKRTYMATCIGCIALVFMQFFAPSLGVLTAGEILAGLLWGCMVLIGPTYASEISQIKLRGILTAMNNLAFVIGQFIANGLALGFSTNNTKWAYKVPFALQWIWPLIIAALLPFAPESPYWLVRQNRLEDAKVALKKISASHDTEASINAKLALIIKTDALEKEMEQTTSYKDLFRGTNLRRTEICSVIYCIQVLCGVGFAMNYSTYFFELAGIATTTSFDLSLGSTAIGFVATCSSWVVLSYVGRRSFYISVLAFTDLLLWIIGFLDCAKDYDTNPNYAWAQASMMLVWSFAYQISVGPLCFVINGEVPSTKLRGKTIAVATAFQAVLTIVATVAIPYMINTDAGNLRGKCGFVFGAFTLLCVVWCYFRLPETGGRSFEELDIMFHKKVPTKKFKNYKVYSEDEFEVLSQEKPGYSA